MSLEQLQQHLKQCQDKYPPVELWDPPYCGELDIVIKADGRWFYNGSVISRQPMVKLFASVLKKEEQEYYLVTPVEKIKISVIDQPFLITQWQIVEGSSEQNILLTTNLGDEFILSSEHPLIIENDKLLVTVRRNLQARVNRNVFYQLIDIAAEIQTDKRHELVIQSAGQSFSLGSL